MMCEALQASGAATELKSAKWRQQKMKQQK